MLSNNKEIKPLFSIITACYNGIPWMKTWFDSIMAQTYRPLEVVMSDDASDDSSVRMARKFKKSFTNNGIIFSVNKNKKRRQYGQCLSDAYQRCNGSYVGILDIDDCLCSWSIEHVMDLYFRHPDIGHIYTQFEVCDKDLNRNRTGFCAAPRDGESILSMSRDYKEHIYSHFKTFKNVHDSHKIFPTSKCCVDLSIGLNLEEQYPGGFTNKICYQYRSNVPGSISAVHGTTRRLYWNTIIKQFIKSREFSGAKPFPIIKIN